MQNQPNQNGRYTGSRRAEIEEAVSETKTVGELLNDPKSNLSRNIAKARETMRENDKVIAAWMAKGYTREQAWREALSA